MHEILYITAISDNYTYQVSVSAHLVTLGDLRLQFVTYSLNLESGMCSPITLRYPPQLILVIAVHSNVQTMIESQHCLWCGKTYITTGNRVTWLKYL